MEKWAELYEQGERTLPITSTEMTRWFITLEDAAEMAMRFLGIMEGGEVFVPRMRAYRIVDIGKDLYHDCEFMEVGIRAGERLHEPIISREDAPITVEFDKFFVTDHIGHWLKMAGAKRVPLDFPYSSEGGLPWRD